MDESEKLQRNKFYPLSDWPNEAERKQYNLTLPIRRDSAHAVWDGSPRRCPKKGEWYLSGSIIEAYRAPNDLSTPYHIAFLVATVTKTVITARD